jgi:hypothetical protein
VVRAWTVRGGRHGEREQAALDEGMIILGWGELDDLSNIISVDQLYTALRDKYPNARSRTTTSWAHELWRFLKVMNVGDLVVMPQKYEPMIAIGRVIGEYEYRADVPSELRHVRRVEWLNPAVERTAVGTDLRRSMNSLLTVSELSQRDAVQRVQSLADSGSDPETPPFSPEILKAEIGDSGAVQLSARDLMGLWGWQPHTTEGLELVEHGLADLGLVVEPQLTEVRSDSLVTVSNAVNWRSESAWVADKPIYLRVAWGPPSQGPTYASDLVGALWNIELLYDFSLLLAHPAYQGFNLANPGEFFATGWRTVGPEHRLQAVLVEHHSPLLFLAVIPVVAAGAAGIWAITQSAEKIADFNLNRQKLKADLSKAKADARRAESEALRAEAKTAEYQRLLSHRQAGITAAQLKEQVQATPMPILEAEFTNYRRAGR